MDKCIEFGHAFQVIAYVRVNDSDRVEKRIECMECGDQHEDYIDIDEVQFKDEILEHCDDCGEDYEQDDSHVCEDDTSINYEEYDPEKAHRELLQTLADIRKDHNWSG